MPSTDSPTTSTSPSVPSEERQQLEDSLDKLLIRVLDHGQDKADGNGSVVKVTPDAKLLEVVLERLKMLGIGDPARAGTPAGDLAKRAERAATHLKLHRGGDGPPPLENPNGTPVEPA